MQIPGLSGLDPGMVLKRALKEFLDDDMLTHASALAYQVLFSLFPFILFLGALLSFLNLSNFFDWLRSQTEVLLPPQATDQVNRVIGELQQPQGGLLSVGIALALWAASAGVRSVMNALNVAYEVAESRPAWKRYALSIFYTIGLAALLILAAGLMILGPQVIQWLAQQVGLEQLFVTLWTWLRWPVAIVLLMLAVAIVYYMAPNVEQPFRFITPGSTLSVLVWIAASLGFGYYVQNIANYNAMYGSIGAIIILLFYFFLSATVLLLGAEVNAVIEQHARRSSESQAGH
jgi:membrane protein